MSNHSGRFGSVIHPILFGVVVTGLAGVSQAASKAEKQKAAEQLVQEALHREIYGLSDEREQLLKQALEQTPDYAPAMWHLGYVKVKNQWLKADEVLQQSKEDPRLAQYREMRDSAAETADGQLTLANWCNKRGLADQELAHLTNVLRFDPNHAEARARLGFRSVDGVWMRIDEIRAELDQAQEDRKSLTDWKPKLEKILSGLHQRSELKRKGAEEQLLAINEIAAIPALEIMLSNDSEAAALIVIEAVARMNHPDASLSLARHAIYSPWPNVRQAAAAKLKDRPEDSFIPALLASLYTPLDTRMQLFRGPGGRLIYRQSFQREGQDENQMLVLNTEYRRISAGTGDRDTALAQAMANMNARAMARAQSVAQQNRQTIELNSRIMQALGVATDQIGLATPESWWDWWNQHNEVFIEGSKQTRTYEATEQVAIVDPILRLQAAQASAAQLAKDCLAAGTRVWTASGPVAIEDIKIGDLVLSQNTETGELAFKPVLRTTVRPEGQLVKIIAEGATIETSGGHPFWVAGEAWVKARDLKSGMELHGATSAVMISSVERTRIEKTYNLIVADFNTYFIGDAKVLSHDNTVREATSTVVPGLLEQ